MFLCENGFDLPGRGQGHDVVLFYFADPFPEGFGLQCELPPLKKGVFQFRGIPSAGDISLQRAGAFSLVCRHVLREVPGTFAPA